MESKLLEYVNQYPNVDLFYSPDIKEDFELDSNDVLKIKISDILEDFISKNELNLELTRLWKIKMKNPKIGILYAHGTSFNGAWMYELNRKDEELLIVQNFIDSMDGKYSSLLLCCCNNGHHEISSKKSIVIAPNEIFSGERLFYGEVQTEAFVPGIGYIDSYVGEYEINRLKKLILRKDNKN